MSHLGPNMAVLSWRTYFVCEAATVEFRLLGPVEAGAPGQVVDLRGPRERALLARLLVSANHVVPADSIAEDLWSGDPPPGGLATLHVYVSRLRRALGDHAADLVTQPPGYRLIVPDDKLDVARFERLAGAGDAQLAAGRPDLASELISQALRLWRGPALADVADLSFAQDYAARLEEARTTATETRAEAELRCGKHTALVAELEGLSASHPMRERFWGQLILALYRCDRQADALAAFGRLRRNLAEELGIDPSPAICELHERVLRHDPQLDWQPVEIGARAAGKRGREQDRHGSADVRDAGAVRAGHAAGLRLPGGSQQVPGGDGGRPGPSAPLPAGTESRTEFGGLLLPRQLPAGPRYFAGRAAELKLLDGLIEQTSRPPGTVMISAISGPGGVGKTALALHWAHKVADRFADGQLYANLRGFDPAGSPAPAAQVVRGFLEGFGVPPAGIPASPDAQASLYRSLSAGRRLLIVLDNARDAAQVRPLLPGGDGCLVLVTSRSDLAGLVAAECALPLPLGTLSADEGWHLLSMRLGAERLSAEPAAAAELTRLCAGLPLALGVAAARAVARPEQPLALLAAQLAQGPGQLDVFETWDEVTSLRAVFSWSYGELPVSAARMFRLLGLHPGPDIGAAAAASLAAVSIHQARRSLAVLVSASLLAEARPARYALHDLLRAYAAEQAEQAETEAARRAAVHRMLDHYLHTANRAASLLRGSAWRIVTAVPQPGVMPELLADKGEAIDWYDAERTVLVATAELAGEAGFDVHGWQLPWAVRPYLFRTGHWQDLGVLLRLGLAAAGRLADPLALSRMRFAMAIREFRSGAYVEALAHASEASRHCEATGDTRLQADCHATQGFSLKRLGRLEEALQHAEQALELSRAVGYLDTEIGALVEIGELQAKMGNPGLGIEYCRQAVALEQDAEAQASTVAAALDTMAQVQLQAGDVTDAIASYREAIGRLRRLGDKYGQAYSLLGLGDAHEAEGDDAAAQQAWREGLSILGQMHHPDAERVRARLRQSSGSR